jgi:hypothetical protein
LNDELLDELPYVDFFYRYLHGVGYQLARQKDRAS